MRNLVNCSFQVGWLGGLSWPQIKCLSHTKCRILSNTWGVVKKNKTRFLSWNSWQSSRREGFPRGSDGKGSTWNAGDWVQSLDWEDPLEEDMATHSSVLAWRMPWTGEPGGLRSIGSQRVRHNWPSTALVGGMLRCSIRQEVKSLRSQCVCGLPLGLSWWRIHLQCRRPGFKPWVGLPTPVSGLENSMDCIVHGVAKSGTRLTDFHFHFQGVCILFTVMIWHFTVVV